MGVRRGSDRGEPRQHGHAADEPVPAELTRWVALSGPTAAATDAIDKAVPVPEVTTDIGSENPRRDPDLGAHVSPGP